MFIKSLYYSLRYDLRVTVLHELALKAIHYIFLENTQRLGWDFSRENVIDSFVVYFPSFSQMGEKVRITWPLRFGQSSARIFISPGTDISYRPKFCFTRLFRWIYQRQWGSSTWSFITWTSLTHSPTCRPSGNTRRTRD